jgi:16S rRNA (cytosine1402-N4)-methyltransferase
VTRPDPDPDARASREPPAEREPTDADGARRPARRPRYRGTHPRRFEQKYKELDPERYPGLVEHVRARGRTPAGQHVPILMEEVLASLAPRPGERGVDCTLGFGGHARRLLEQLAPGGSLLGLDADPVEIVKTEIGRAHV